MRKNKDSITAKSRAASWAMKAAMTATVLGSSVGLNAGTALADHHFVNSDGGMPTSAKTTVLGNIEALQFKEVIGSMPEAAQHKLITALEAVQHKIEQL